MTTPTEDQLIAYWEEWLWEEHRFYVQQFVDDDGTTRWEALCWRTDGEDRIVGKPMSHPSKLHAILAALDALEAEKERPDA